MSGGLCPSSKWHYYEATHSCFYVSTTKAVWSDADLACRNMGGYLASIKNHAQMSFVYSNLSVLLEKLCYCRPELSMGLLCVTRYNPTHQLTDPTQPTTSGNIWTLPIFTTNNEIYSLAVTYFIHITYLVLLVNQASNVLYITIHIKTVSLCRSKQAIRP